MTDVEKPQVWRWDVTGEYWEPNDTKPPYAEVATTRQHFSVFVTATIDTRDELRDEGLAWAKRASLGQVEE